MRAHTRRKQRFVLSSSRSSPDVTLDMDAGEPPISSRRQQATTPLLAKADGAPSLSSDAPLLSRRGQIRGHDGAAPTLRQSAMATTSTLIAWWWWWRCPEQQRRYIYFHPSAWCCCPG
ncbi:hypothetical protein BRADI_4g23117v3 [Brachypodium distachyon]|uniref:Uncharacterized protein n=1 Tax=Brachypodium distachyon TaxID=15368 RepID=A0A2K2CPM4_BRADI|nr:hypothetical protein BRADI_4g23117v3 [Brachypodium distachyon]